jgi:hypothetical protein
MDNLQEAYLNVYSAQENIEEGLRSAVQRLLGGKKQEPAPATPESRGAQLRQRYNVGPEKSDTSAKRKILDRSKANADRAQKQVDMGNASQSYATAANDAHTRYLKAGYSKYGADDARGKGNKAAKRAAALNREEFDWIVDTLLDEGYDLSTYTVDEFYNICLEEVDQLDEITRSMGRRATQYRRDQEQAAHMERVRVHQEKMANDPAYKKAHMDSLKTHERGSQTQAESFDLFDYLLEYLVAEGYADTNAAAIKIMANMSEEWKESIVEVKLDPRGRPASGPMNVYANPKGKPDQAHLDAVKAYDEKQKKKTPEQRKAELDAYKARKEYS